MMHVTRIGFMRDQTFKSENVQTFENILQNILRKMEANGHMVIGLNLFLESSLPGEVAQAYVYSQFMEAPEPKAEPNRIVSPS